MSGGGLNWYSHKVKKNAEGGTWSQDESKKALDRNIVNLHSPRMQLFQMYHFSSSYYSGHAETKFIFRDQQDEKKIKD